MKNEIPCSNMVLSLRDNKTNVDFFKRTNCKMQIGPRGVILRYTIRDTGKLLTSPSESCLCSGLGPFCDFRGGRSGAAIVVTDCSSWDRYPPA